MLRLLELYNGGPHKQPYAKAVANCSSCLGTLKKNQDPLICLEKVAGHAIPKGNQKWSVQGGHLLFQAGDDHHWIEWTTKENPRDKLIFEPESPDSVLNEAQPIGADLIITRWHQGTHARALRLLRLRKTANHPGSLVLLKEWVGEFQADFSIQGNPLFIDLDEGIPELERRVVWTLEAN